MLRPLACELSLRTSCANSPRIVAGQESFPRKAGSGSRARADKPRDAARKHPASGVAFLRIWIPDVVRLRHCRERTSISSHGGTAQELSRASQCPRAEAPAGSGRQRAPPAQRKGTGCVGAQGRWDKPGLPLNRVHRYHDARLPRPGGQRGTMLQEHRRLGAGGEAAACIP